MEVPKTHGLTFEKTILLLSGVGKVAIVVALLNITICLIIYSRITVYIVKTIYLALSIQVTKKESIITAFEGLGRI